MSNPFYNYSGNFIPGTLARAETVGVEFSAVQAGFAQLAVQGVDSGAANAYIVTTGGAPTGAYSDGQNVQVKLLNSNSTTATVNVNSIGAVALVRSTGAALQAGDVIANTWYALIYNSTYGAFTLNNPVTQATVPGTISAAAPTHKVGLVAAGGVSTAAVPIDATYAIDQSIAPTWTAVHTFSATPVMNSGLTVTGAAITSSAGLTVSAGGATFTAGSVVVGVPTGGGQGTGTINATGLFVNGVAVATGTVTSVSGTANQIAVSASTGAVTLSLPSTIVAPGDLVVSQGLQVVGTGTTGFAGAGTELFNTGTTGGLQAYNRSSAAFIPLGISGSTVTLNAGPSALAALSINTTGNITTAAPSSGTGVTITGLVGATALSVSDLANYTFTVDRIPAGTGARIGGTTGSALVLMANATTAITIATTGSVTVATPSSGSALIVGTIASGFTLQASDLTNTGAFIGFSGTHDWQFGNLGAFAVQLMTNSLVRLAVASDGGVTVGAAPTGGSQGVGTINAAGGYYINGVNQFATGSFTATYTGIAGPVTATAQYVVEGKTCTIVFAAGTGTSNATSFTITGLPAAIQPVRAQTVPCSYSATEDAGIVGGASVEFSFAASSGTVSMLKVGSTNGWTGSNVKGFANAASVTYMLN